MKNQKVTKHLIDTNVILRFLVRDIESQYLQAKSLLQDAEAGACRVIITHEVIIEVTYILTKFYLRTKEQVVNALVSFLELPYIDIEVDKDTMLDALNLWSKENLDIVDLLQFRKATSYNYNLYTFDKRLKSFR